MNRYVPVTVILATVMLAASFAYALSDESDAAATTCTIEGTVTDTSSGAIEGLAVKITSGTTTYAGTVDDTTYSVSGIPAEDDLDSLTITFFKLGMTVSSIPSGYYKDNEDGSYTLKLDGVTPVTSGSVDTYDITSESVIMTETTFSAYLMIEDSSGNTPLSRIAIPLSNSISGYSETVMTGTDGSFTFHPSTLYNLRLSANASEQGYSFLGGLYFATAVSDDVIVFNLKGSNPDLGIPSYEIKSELKDGVKQYSLTEDYPFLVGYSTGLIRITVTDNGGNTLQGVSVRLNSDDSSQKYIEDTDENGVAEFSNVRIGKYEVNVKVGGFEEYTSQVDISKGTNPSQTMELSSKKEQDFFGMNFSHFMMILGVAIGLILVLISFLMYSGRLKSRLEED